MQADKEGAFGNLSNDAFCVRFEPFEICHDSICKGDESDGGSPFGNEFGKVVEEVEVTCLLLVGCILK